MVLLANKCPGQDSRYWKPEDVFNVPCPVCGEEVEFFKDDLKRTCPNCGYRFENPRLNLGCLEWCPHADECLAILGRQPKKPKAKRKPS